MRQTLAWILVCMGLAAAGVIAGHMAELRVRNALALQCARSSAGTDAAIAECYTRRDLPVPADL